MEEEQVGPPDFDETPSSTPPPPPMPMASPVDEAPSRAPPPMPVAPAVDEAPSRAPPPMPMAPPVDEVPSHAPPPMPVASAVDEVPSRAPPPMPVAPPIDEVPSRAPPPMPVAPPIDEVPSRAPPPMPVAPAVDEVPSRAPPPMPVPPAVNEVPSRAPPPMPVAPAVDEVPSRAPPPMPEAPAVEKAEVPSRAPPPIPTRSPKPPMPPREQAKANSGDDGLPGVVNTSPMKTGRSGSRPVSSRVKERQAAMFGEKKEVEKKKIEISGGGVAARLAALRAQAEKDKAERHQHAPVVSGGGGGVKERLASLKLTGFDAEKLAARAGGRPSMGLPHRPSSGGPPDDAKANLIAKKSRIESQLGQARIRGGDDVEDLEQQLTAVEDEIAAITALEEAKKAESEAVAEDGEEAIENKAIEEEDTPQAQVKRVVVKPGRRKKTVKRMVPGEALVQAVEPLAESSTPTRTSVDSQVTTIEEHDEVIESSERPTIASQSSPSMPPASPPPTMPAASPPPAMPAASPPPAMPAASPPPAMPAASPPPAMPIASPPPAMPVASPPPAMPVASQPPAMPVASPPSAMPAASPPPAMSASSSPPTATSAQAAASSSPRQSTDSSSPLSAAATRPVVPQAQAPLPPAPAARPAIPPVVSPRPTPPAPQARSEPLASAPVRQQTPPAGVQGTEEKKGGGFMRRFRKTVANKTGKRGALSGKSKAVPQKPVLGVEEAAQVVEALGGNFVGVAGKMREARIDTNFLNSLHGTDLDETLADLGATDRLSRRRLMYELKLDAADS